MKAPRISFFGILILIFFSSFSCENGEKSLRNQIIDINPHFVPLSNGRIDFEILVGIPAKFFKKIDSIHYRLVPNDKPEITFHTVKMSNNDKNETRDNMVYHRELVKSSLTLSQDTTGIYVVIEYFRNGMSREFYPNIQIGKIIKNKR